MKINQLMRLISSLMFLGSLTACGGDWRTASHESAGLAPPAEQVEQDIFQIYVARAWSWRGYFAVYPWVAWKKSNESEYTTAAVLGFRLRRGLDAVVVKQDLPDRQWYGSKPEMIFQAQGEKASVIIEKVQKLIAEYPYKDSYRVWPGPNSNTFVSYLIRNVGEIDAELPPHAIGKDWLVESYLIDSSPMGRGVQINALGVAGVTVGLDEGIEFNVLGLNFGLDVYPPALKLPLLGRVGMQEEVDAYEVRQD